MEALFWRMRLCLYSPGLDPEYELCRCSVCTNLRTLTQSMDIDSGISYEQCICHQCARSQIGAAYPELEEQLQDLQYRSWRSEQEENKQLSTRYSGTTVSADFVLIPDLLRRVFTFVGSDEADTIAPVCKQWRILYYWTFQGRDNVRNANFAQSLRKYKHIHTRVYHLYILQNVLVMSDTAILSQSQYLWWYSLDQFPERHPELHALYEMILDHPNPHFLWVLQRHPVFGPPERRREILEEMEDNDYQWWETRHEPVCTSFLCDHVHSLGYR